MNKKVLIALLFTVLGFGAYAQGGGLVLYEVGNTGIGNSSAGASALSRDASSLYTNPASITEVEGNVFSAGLQNLDLTLDYQEAGSDKVYNAGGPTPGIGLYWLHHINEKVTIGTTFNAAAGTGFGYDDEWNGRYIMDNVLFGVLNLAPTVAYRLNDQWSFGATFNIYYSLVDLNIMAPSIEGNLPDFSNLPELPNLPIRPGTSALVELGEDQNLNAEGANFNFGAQFGVHYRPSEETRIGFMYRMGSTQTLEADLTLGETKLAPALTADIPLVDGLNLGIAHRIGKFDLLADFGYSFWGQLDSLPLRLPVSGDLPIVGEVDETIAVSKAYGWDNTWRIGFGANYYHGNGWTFQTGYSYDSSAVEEHEQTIDIPAFAMHRLSFGAQKVVSEKIELGLHYTRSFSPEGSEFTHDSVIQPITGEYKKFGFNAFAFTLNYRY